MQEEQEPAPTTAVDAGTLREETASHRFFVVGVGASAGGLEALGELIGHAPLDCMAFVVVQHLAPQHESLLAQLLSRTTKLDVVTAADGMAVEPNHVYVIPPNADIAIMQGVLHLISPPGGYGPRLPIDFFFRSLADDQGSSAVGIILSGTGTDGTFGLKAIKASGGITFVQEPSSAKYDGMPRSALASGSADFCQTPRQIGDELSRISTQPHPLIRRPEARAQAPQIQENLAKLLVLIRAQFGTDLSQYKPATVERRVERRMTLHKLDRIDEYVRYVQANPAELADLYKDMLIAVTSFFRDRGLFEALRSTILPQALEKREVHAPVRLWVPACATGEEAYSLAICLVELLEAKTPETKIQIFGTDVDEESVQHARRGAYSQNITADVSPERLHRFFVQKDGHYHVCRQIRDMVVFSKQNLLKDAPFSRLDLVSCRNLLIYLKPTTQKKALRILHYALNPSGFLVLGTSETVGDAPDLFSLVDRKNKIYAKKHAASVALIDGGFGVPRSPEMLPPASPPRPSISLQAIADRKILDLYGPPAVVINENREILHFRGHTGRYLDPSPGAASLDILRLARPELHIELKTALQKAFSEQVSVSQAVQLHEDGKPRTIKLDVVPIQEPETKTRCLLVLFQELPSPQVAHQVTAGGDPEPAESAEVSGSRAQRVAELERELAVAREYLQTTLEEKEGANEELKATNEELQSSNEELQSTNEELETSKEEMQSTNEELTTINDELQNRMAELSQANDDLHNVLTGVDNVVVIVGMDLRIRRFTAAAERLFNMVPADIGRLVSFLNTFIGAGDMERIVARVIETLSTVEEEVLTSNHRWYSLRVAPYKTLDHSIRGAVITLTDIDVRKKAADLTRDVGAYASESLAAIGHPLVIVDGKARVVWANSPFYATFKLAPEETTGNILSDVGDRQMAVPGLRELIEGAVTAGKVFRGFRMRYRPQDNGERTMKVGGSRIPVATESTLVLLSFEEDTSAPRGDPRP
jgi:two-component system, chemotaxis family, CheB/CheR fusion protein